MTKKGEKMKKRSTETRRYLRVNGQIHSLLFELGRFTRTLGWHYYIDLRVPAIVHHKNSWSITPYRNGAFAIGDIFVHEDYIEVYGKNYRYDGLFNPFFGGISARTLYREIIDAIAKYAVGAFLNKEYADGDIITVDLHNKIVPKRIKDDEKLKLAEDDNLVTLINDLNEFNIFVKLDDKHLPLLKNGEYSDKWRIVPCDFVREYFIINNKYILAYDTLYLGDFLYENERHGIKLCNNFYVSAKNLYDAILSTIVKYALERFRVDTTKISKLTINFESTR
jgi:hypothetical protein